MHRRGAFFLESGGGDASVRKVVWVFFFRRRVFLVFSQVMSAILGGPRTRS